MATKPVGLYIHIPFCVRKCNYCDFCSFPLEKVLWKDDYLNALIAEISLYKSKAVTIDTIFFGGGTPSLLSSDDFRMLVDTIKTTFLLAPDCEFTVEVNPGTLSEEKVKAFVSNGVNRISIGLQSIHDNELKKLGRIHNYDDFLSSYQLVRDAGIENINVDLMYGIPGQTMESFSQTLDAVTSVQPEHISIYGLILEEGTPFYENRCDIVFPDEDAECDMYFLASDFMNKKGYSHYEISNYSLPGMECKHNLKYWRCEEYIGVGIAAYSFFEGIRFGNSKIVKEYLDQNNVKYDYQELVDIDTAAYEYVMLSLRLKEGVSLSEYRSRFGRDFSVGREQILMSLSNGGYIEINDDRLFLTERGFYVSNRILTELL